MLKFVLCAAVCAIALLASVTLFDCDAMATQLQTVFVIAMENHNWTQPANQFTGHETTRRSKAAAICCVDRLDPRVQCIQEHTDVKRDQRGGGSYSARNVLLSLKICKGACGLVPARPLWIWRISQAARRRGVLRSRPRWPASRRRRPDRLSR